MNIAHRQFAYFMVAGIFNTGFSYALYAAGLWFGLHYATANFVALVISVCVSFFISKKIVFSVRTNGLFLRFVLFWFFLWIINVGLIGVIMRLGLDAYWAGAVALVPMVGVSFLVQRNIVFREKPSG